MMITWNYRLICQSETDSIGCLDLKLYLYVSCLHQLVKQCGTVLTTYLFIIIMEFVSFSLLVWARQFRKIPGIVAKFYGREPFLTPTLLVTFYDMQMEW